MKNIIITRHSGAVEWLSSKGFVGEVLTHISPENVFANPQRVIGVLPIHIAAELIEAGHEVYIIIMPNLPPELRGRELTADDMEKYSARLVKINSLELSDVI